MNIQQLRDSGWIIYEVISGSHAYGTNIEGSDIDHRGVFIMPTDEILGTVYYPQVSDEKNDTTFYEIRTFLELLAKGNPNMLELLHTPEDCIVFKDSMWDKFFTAEVKARFLTKKLKHTFLGYSHSQLKKANSLNKLMNWEVEKTERKDVLDFCYVLGKGEESQSFKYWINDRKVGSGGWGPKQVKEGVWIPGFEPQWSYLKLDNIGLANVNNFPDLYSMYYLAEGGGMISDDSNDVQLRTIPVGATHLGYLRFNKEGYSQHCKDYRQYKEWLANRNINRFIDTTVTSNQKNARGYIDSKNALHLLRLLYMAREIAQGKGIIVRRPEAAYLIDIRKGKYDLQTILDSADNIVKEIGESFDKSDLPAEVSTKFVHELLKSFRRYMWIMVRT